MRHHHSPADGAVDRDLGAADRAPAAVLGGAQLADGPGGDTQPPAPGLVAPDGPQQPARGIPFGEAAALARPVWLVGRDGSTRARFQGSSVIGKVETAPSGRLT